MFYLSSNNIYCFSIFSVFMVLYLTIEFKSSIEIQDFIQKDKQVKFYLSEKKMNSTNVKKVL